MDKVKVFAPASVANVGCGYDTIGFAVDAIGEELELVKRADSQLKIADIIGADLSREADQNVASIAIRSLLDALGSEQGFDITIHKHFKPGSGLGSSASSAAGAVFAANELLGKPFQKEELVPFALEGEAFASKCYHADNVAPSLLGGIQVIRSYDPLELFRVDTEMNPEVLIIFPDVEVKTAASKQLIPDQIPVSIARDQWANVAAFIHALHTNDYQLLQRSITDFVAEPVRKELIPKYEEVRMLMMDAGCVGFNISGSGPSMFALFEDAVQDDMVETCSRIYSDLEVRVYRTKIDFKGCRVIT